MWRTAGRKGKARTPLVHDVLMHQRGERIAIDPLFVRYHEVDPFVAQRDLLIRSAWAPINGADVIGIARAADVGENR
ncbi:hypothetical protein [Mycobacteroides salmoniphilum]|uniref:hypothetical protein n=2 Tax=Mycobacteroides salmoniphilum TaxID=404941 RepID=UPI00106693E5|nr:hypothetical protein [Mycobacteroides salmoniphilum]